MKNAANSEQGIDCFAVIRQYEPARIERELLAQVFEIVSRRSECEGEHVDQQSVSTHLYNSQVADDGQSPSRRGLGNPARRESLEPAA